MAEVEICGKIVNTLKTITSMEFSKSEMNMFLCSRIR